MTPPNPWAMNEKRYKLHRGLDVDPRLDGTPAGAIVCFAHTHRVPAGSMQGKKFRLNDQQLEFVESIYNNLDDEGKRKVRQAFLSMPRRNGKTATCAVLTGAHHHGPMALRNSLLISAANDREQAGIIFDFVAAMIETNPISKRMTKVIPSGKRITNPKLRTVYRSISAEARTKLGTGPDLIVYDEMSSARSRVLFDNLTSSAGSQPEPLFVGISTQAANDQHFFSELIDYSVRCTSGDMQGEDESVVGYLFAAPKNCDIEDEEIWALCNPGYGKYRSKAEMASAAKKAKRMPSAEMAFRNLYLNQRVSAHASLFTPAIWDKGAGPVDEALFQKQPVFCGLDLSSRKDITCLAIAVEDPDTEIVHAKLISWTPEATLDERAKLDRAPYRSWVDAGHLKTTPGKSIGYDFVVVQMAEVLHKMEVEKVFFDPWNIDKFQNWMDEKGIFFDMEKFGQGYRSMSPAVDSFEHIVSEERLIHGDNPVLRWMIGNTVIQSDPAGNRKPAKHISHGRIDGAVALAMALHGIERRKLESSRYNRDEGEAGLVILE